MKAARRFVDDESGMTLALAMIMIVIIGAMGAGLLTFVNRDLITVVEENRGQKAFEMADAGIMAAKRQLASSVDRTKYDGNGIETPTDDNACGSDDYQWSALRCGTPTGLTLNDLDGDSTTADSVNVTIRYYAAAGTSAEYFRVISTGTYGDAPRIATRKIEAIFKGVGIGGGGNIIGHPLYYTPSNIKLESTSTKHVTLSAMSLFTEGDILIQGLSAPPDTSNPQSALVADMEDKDESKLTGEVGKDAITTGGTSDALCDWDSLPPMQDPGHCFVNATGGWNDAGRVYVKNKTSTATEYFKEPGLAAEGKICRYDASSLTPAKCGTSTSVADGVYGYDSTTGAKTYLRKDGATFWQHVWGNNLKFVAKERLVPPLQQEDPNLSGTITYPFPRPAPIPSSLKQKAINQGRYYKGTSPNWDTLFDNNSAGKVVFVDAENSVLHFSTSDNAKNKGTLVVWCGDLQQDQSFTGIIINLYGDDSDMPGVDTTCGPDKGVYRNNGVLCECWTFAKGGTTTRAGIEIAPNSTLKFVPSGDFSFLNDAFSGPPPTSFALESWRELYS